MALCWVAATLLLAAGLLVAAQATAGPPVRNILYVVVDDLRPELPMYGQTHMQTPHLSSLAARGLTFNRAYAQQAVCAPSRNSFMSGRRPDQTKAFNFLTDFRDVGADWISMPGYFKQHAYLSLGTGKLYHEDLPPNGDGTNSWSNLPEQFSCNNSGAGGAGTYCDPKMLSCKVPGKKSAPNPRWCTVNATAEGDGAYFADRATVDDAVLKLRYAAANLEQHGQPFFLGVGLRKPHLDWRIPAPYLDLYPSVPMPKHRRPPAHMPDVAYHDVARSDGERALWAGWGFVDPWTPMRNETVEDMRRHYYAATSFMDTMLGMVLAELEALGLSNSTAVLFHADHGWALGENNMFRKFHNTELATRVPLIVAVPWLPTSHGKHTDALAELVDVYPTLADLAGLPPPGSAGNSSAPLAGTSLVPLLQNPAARVKDHALSQYPRCPTDRSVLWRNNWCIEVKASEFFVMGYSLRTEQYRYTAWLPWDGNTLSAVFPATRANGTGVFFEELFAYGNNTSETDFDALDIAEVSAEQPAVAQAMFERLKALVGGTGSP